MMLKENGKLGLLYFLPDEYKKAEIKKFHFAYFDF